MNIQRHERIIRIKTISRYLYWSLTAIHTLLWALLPMSIGWLWLGSKGAIKLYERSIEITSLSDAQRWLLMIVIVLILLVLVTVIHHLRQLILHFAQGNIFNKAATLHARKALHYAMGLYATFIACTLASWGYLYSQHKYLNITLNADFILGIIIFAFMYVLLWALEIGCELNEESELTI
jgi:uncharacterized metal-binding protein